LVFVFAFQKNVLALFVSILFHHTPIFGWLTPVCVGEFRSFPRFVSSKATFSLVKTTISPPFCPKVPLQALGQKASQLGPL
jgi:hypothetical protein